ncbi:MAG: Ig-like domain-containing protein [Nitrospirae bacterium]|nr:Ig-like domain-containing protein [Nitrospirota bacterium]
MNRHKGYAKMLFLVLLLVVFVAGCSSSSDDNGGVSADTTAPTVISTIPLDLATDVARNITVNATFSAVIDPATITITTFTLKQGTTSVSGTVACVGTTATFTPEINLAVGAEYTATITTGVKDLAGKALATNYVWIFTTGTATDTTPPTVSYTSPLDLATGVAINITVNATFSEVMSAATLTTATFTLQQGTTPVSGTVTYDGTTATFTPTSDLASSTTYTATITTGVKDLAGKALATNYVWAFTTGTTTDTIAPTVISTTPLDGATGVSRNRNVNATFDEVMSAATLNTATFTLQQGTTPVSGTATYVGTTATFNPASNLTAGTTYTATITTGVKDLAGNALASDKVWSFTTGTTTAAGPDPVILGSAGNYAILAKTGVDTIPPSAVTGNVGVSPAARGFLTGWSQTAASDALDKYSTSDQVVAPFRLYAADYAEPTPTDLGVAVLSMQAAYTDAAGRTATSAATTNVGGGTLTDLTLVTGVYEWGSNVTIPTNLTLSGSATDVWIFKVAGTLDMAAAKSVILSGDAQAKNIFWQVSGAVTIGANTHFEGIILGMTKITFGNLASIDGRLLAQTAVNLDATTVTQP